MNHLSNQSMSFDQSTRYWAVVPHQPSEAHFADVLISARQNTSPKRLDEPGPTPEQLNQFLNAAAAAPDHGLLRPWRFVLIPECRRTDLAEAFALALIDRDPTATLKQIEAAREKAQRAPCLILAIARLGFSEPPTPVLEQMVSVGAAIQNLLLSVYSYGFSSGLTSGQAMQSPRMRDLFQLADGEEAVCFVNIGTAKNQKSPRLRPQISDFFSSL